MNIMHIHHMSNATTATTENNNLEMVSIKSLNAGDYFRTVTKNGDVSKETYLRGSFNREYKRYSCQPCSDALGNDRLFAGNKMVTITFEY